MENMKCNSSSVYGKIVTSEVLDATDKTFCFYDHIEEAERLYVILHSPRYMGKYVDTDSVKEVEE